MAEMDFSMYKQPRRDPLAMVGNVIGIAKGVQETKLLGEQVTAQQKVIQSLDQKIGSDSLQALGGMLGTWAVAHPNEPLTDDKAVELFQQAGNMGLIGDPTHVKELIRMGKIFPGGYKPFVRTLFEHAIPAGSLTPGPVVNGQPTQVPTSAFVEGVSGGGGAPPAPTPVAPGGGGGGPPAPGSVPATDDTGGPAAPAVAGASGAKLGAEAAATEQFAGGTKLLHQTFDAAAAATNQAGLIQNVLQDAEKYRTSGAADALQGFLTSFNSIFGTQIGAGDIAAGDALRKTVNQMALTFASQFGQTPQQLAAAFAGTPNSTMSNGGIEKASAFLQGSLAGMNAQAAYMRKAGKEALARGEQPDYYDAKAEFNDHFDLRVFQWPHLSEGDRGDMLAQMGMTKAMIAKKQYTPQFVDWAEKYDWAQKNGLIK